MAGRFFRGAIGWPDYQSHFDLQPPVGLSPPETQANISPGMIVPIIRFVPEGDGPDRTRLELGPVLWGFIPDWFKGRFDEWRRPAFNARSEEVFDSRVFRGAYRHRRCLIPAHGYYLWEGAKGSKMRYAVARRDKAWFCFAAIWERALLDGASYDGLAILTTNPNDAVAGLSARMPVIIHPADYELWLTGTRRQANRLLRSAPPADFTVWPSHDGYPVWP